MSLRPSNLRQAAARQVVPVAFRHSAIKHGLTDTLAASVHSLTPSAGSSCVLHPFSIAQGFLKSYCSRVSTCEGTDPTDCVALPPSVGSLYRLALTRGFLFSRFFCWFGRNWFSDVALNEQLGGGIIDVQNELLLKLHQLDRLTDLCFLGLSNTAQ